MSQAKFLVLHVTTTKYPYFVRNFIQLFETSGSSLIQTESNRGNKLEAKFIIVSQALRYIDVNDIR